MKKSDSLLLATAIAFSGLFYEQLPGINVPLFTLLLTAAVLILNPVKLRDPAWWFYCLCMNLAAWSVFINNSGLSMVATFFTTLIFSSKSFSPASSTILNLGFAFYSLARSPFDLITGSYLHFSPGGEESAKSKKRVILTGTLTAVLIAIFFLILYRASNPLFDEFVSHASFEWLSISFILFTMFSFIVANGLLGSKKIEIAAELDSKFGKDIQQAENHHTALSFDVVTAVTLFSMLNLMLLLINGLDIKHIYISRELPEGITLSQFVHESVASLIFSLAVAGGLIAWLLRGDLNYSRYGKTVRLFIYCWIAQSVFVVLSTLIRNTWYIQEFHLTGLRIGVFVFLVLSLIGLAFTFFKVRNKKSAWWLVTANFQVWFVMLVFTSLVNWDKRITVYNITHSGPTKLLDVKYLAELSDANLPELVKLHNENKLTKKERIMLYKKLNRAYEQNQDLEWPGFNLRAEKSYKALMELDLPSRETIR